MDKYLPYLWNDVKNFYTNKKFKRYTYDSYAKYSEDVYGSLMRKHKVYYSTLEIQLQIRL